jgi:hypothetical protein
LDYKNDCCRDENNHKQLWQLTIYGDWEPSATYCEVCREILEEHNVTGR